MSVVAFCSREQALLPLCRFAYRFARGLEVPLEVVVSCPAPETLEEELAKLEGLRPEAFPSVEKALSEDSAFQEPFKVEVTISHLNSKVESN